MPTPITSTSAPQATGSFSQAILHNAKYTMELSGQIGIDPEIGKLVAGGIAAETEQVLRNIGAVLSQVGWNYGNIVKARIFLTDMANYGVVNEIYGKYFPENPPARVALAVKALPLGALVEIECVAVGDKVNS